MTTTKSNILLPYLEDTGLDGKKLYTPKEWTERLRHYIKRIHDIDIKPALSGETMPTSNEWTTKEPEIRQDFIWGAGPSAIETITKGEFNTDPDTIKTEKLVQLFKDYYMPKRNTYHSRGDFFWAKQEDNETPEEHWRKLVSLEKNCEFKDIKQEDLLISKFITSITDKKLREKLIREKTLNLKTTMDLVTQDSYEKRHKQSTIPPALAKEKEIKEEPIQKIQPRNYRKNTEITAKNNNCGFCGQQNWSPSHKCPAKTAECNNCHKMGHFARVCRSKTNKNTRKQKINYLEETKSEWKITEKNNVLVYEEHGGKKNNKVDVVTSWLKFIRAPQSWAEAKVACENVGGHLFYELNGTDDQLQFLYDKMGGNMHWLGIYRGLWCHFFPQFLIF